MQEPSVRTGLYTTAACSVPLSGVSIDAEVSNFCARVTVTQRYVNREPTPIEAVYLFPLEEGAAVCAFEALVDGVLVVGEVKEREAAFTAYDEAMERGDGAFLVDEERPDVFQASVGNLAPGKEVLLRLSYVTELSVNSGAIRLSIPTTVSPRYAPANDVRGVGRPDAETLNPPRAWRVPYGLSLSVRLAMSEAITRIESPSHPVSVAIDGHSAEVTLASRDSALDRDFVLAVDAGGLATPQVWCERDESGRSAVAVSFAPDLTQEPTPGEVTFLVDRSGSMGGDSIDEVRNALQLCLRSMIPGCRFSIVGFGSTFHSLFPEPRAYDETSLEIASAHVAAMKADLGGTEILPALEFVLNQPSHSKLTRQVVVLTDGQVSNTDALLALARKHADRARIFTFGIGAGASLHLVRGLARAGGGTAEFIYPGERIEPKVVRQFSRLLSPALTNLRLNWDLLGATQAPSMIPPVFSNGRMVVYAFVDRLQPATLALTADSATGFVRFAVPLDPETATEGRVIATLAARARIREIEEGSDWASPRGSQQRERKASSAVQEIIALSTKYGLLSRETSFVAIERRETPILGDVQLRRVPIALTTGWGGLDRGFDVDAASAPRVAGSAVSSTMDAAIPAMSASGYARPAMDAVKRAIFGSAKLSPPRLPKSKSSPMHRLVALQRANGSWDLGREFAEAIGQELNALEAGMPNALGNRDQAKRAWATALAMTWLRDRAPDAEEQWRLLAVKARRFLDDVGSEGFTADSWLEAAKQFMRPAA